MVGKNNIKQHLVNKGNKAQRFTLRKLKVGVASVSLGALLLIPSATTQVLAETTAENQNVSVAQVSSINQDNLVYENGKLSLVNQEPGAAIVAVLPNDEILEKIVPFHGNWEPRQSLAAKKVYPGDELEFFTYDETGRSESVFLTVTGEGEARPADQGISYGRQAFGFVPTVNSTNVTYMTEPFFTVEMTFPDGSTETQTASVLGQTRFYLPEGYQPKPGDTFRVTIYNRRGELIDLNDPNLFNDPSKNQSEIAVYGEVVEEAPTTPVFRAFGADTHMISLQADPNTAITLTFPDGTTLTQSTNNPGNVNFMLPADLELNVGDVVTAVATNADGVTSEVASYEIPDAYALTNFSVNPILPGAFHEGISGTAAPGAYVTVHLPNGASRAEQADENGNFTISTGYTFETGDPINFSVALNGDVYRFFNVYTVEEAPRAVHTVTIDPNGGTINEDFASTEVEGGELYTLPYGFQSDIQREGHTLTGYTVQGTLLDAAGNQVTEIGRYSAVYTPQSDVTLVANWEETAGGVRFLVHDDNPSAQNERYTVTLTAEDGTEYVLSSNSYGPDSRTWELEDVPNGTYTLSIDGFTITSAEKNGHPDTTSSFTVNEDGTATVVLGFEDDSSTTFIRYKVYGEPEEAPISLENSSHVLARLGYYGARYYRNTITLVDENGRPVEGLTEADFHIKNYGGIVNFEADGNVYKLDTAYAADLRPAHSLSIGEDGVIHIHIEEEVEAPVEDTYSVGVEVRGLDGKRTTDVTITVTDESGTVFEGSFNEYGQWLSEENLPAGDYTITLETPEGTVAEINDTVATQHAVATDQANVFTISVNAETQGNLSSVYAAFKLAAVEEPAPETDADRYEPVFVDEIVLDLNRGNGKLKNPKTLIENMNELPGGIKVAYTNLDQLDLSGETTEQQIVEITVTYRDGSTDTVEVPLQVMPEKQAQKPGRPIFGAIVRKAVRVVRNVATIMGALFSRWF